MIRDLCHQNWSECCTVGPRGGHGASYEHQRHLESSKNDFILPHVGRGHDGVEKDPRTPAPHALHSIPFLFYRQVVFYNPFFNFKIILYSKIIINEMIVSVYVSK